MPTHTAIVKLPALEFAWRVYYVILGLMIFTGPAILLCSILGSLKLALVLIPGCALLGAVVGYFYAGHAFNAFDATLIEGEGVVVRKGVWWREEIMVPISRLQHIDIGQGPLGRYWKMAHMTLHTAGSHDNGTHIYGMALEQAHALRDHLLPRKSLAHD